MSLFVLPLLLALAPGLSREDRVLALLNEAQSFRCFRYASAVFEAIPPPLGNGPVLQAHFPDVTCGSSDSGTFDDVRVRGLALELFTIYGLTVEADRREVEGQKSVVLDGLDPVAKIGFKLRGHGCHEPFCYGIPEHDAAALDETEFAWLSAKGYRLYVADVAGYRGGGDEFTPTLAYLAGLVRFLNDVTDGEDVDLRGLLFEHEVKWTPPFVDVAGVEVSPREYGHELFVERKTTMVLTCRGLPDFAVAGERNPWRPTERAEKALDRDQLRSMRGAPSVLYIQGGARRQAGSDLGPEVHLRLRQVLDGSELVHESRSFAAFLPGRFDLTRPFELELELSPGDYMLGSACIGFARD